MLYFDNFLVLFRNITLVTEAASVIMEIIIEVPFVNLEFPEVQCFILIIF